MLRHPHINRRWAVPAIALLGVLGVGAIPPLFQSAGASTPDLPTLSPAELLAKARTAQVTSLSGTVTLTSNLGIPSLGSLGGRGLTSLTDLLAGQHSAKVWIDGVDHVRIATASPMAETNWIRNGPDLWSYDSTTLRVTHTTLATGANASTTPGAEPIPDPAHETPVEFAKELLDQVTPSTEVTVASPQYVADRPVYELSLAPHAAESTVQNISIAVDAATGLPLEIKIIARSNGATALAFGFTKISFDTPAASTFAFTPPPGSTLREAADITTFINPPQRNHNRDGRTGPPAATAIEPPAGTGAESSSGVPDSIVTAGSDWTTIAILAPGSVPQQVTSLLSSSPQVAVGPLTGRMLSTPLISVLILDDGRTAIGAVTPAALEDAVAKLG